MPPESFEGLPSSAGIIDKTTSWNHLYVKHIKCKTMKLDYTRLDEKIFLRNHSANATTGAKRLA